MAEGIALEDTTKDMMISWTFFQHITMKDFLKLKSYWKENLYLDKKNNTKTTQEEIVLIRTVFET